eukprot:3251622-Prymnesium_polylepis.1
MAMIWRCITAVKRFEGRINLVHPMCKCAPADEPMERTPADGLPADQEAPGEAAPEFRPTHDDRQRLQQPVLGGARPLPSEITSKDPEKPDLARKEDGTLKPAKTTAIADRYAREAAEGARHQGVLQDAAGAGARRRDGRFAAGAPAKEASEAGLQGEEGLHGRGPGVIARATIPRGKARMERLPTSTFKMNVVMMDENADVTFGVKEYAAPVRKPIKPRYCPSLLTLSVEPWPTRRRALTRLPQTVRSQLKKRIRVAIYASFIKMGQARLPVNPDLYE